MCSPIEYCLTDLLLVECHSARSEGSKILRGAVLRRREARRWSGVTPRSPTHSLSGNASLGSVGFVVVSRRSRCLRRSLWEISEIGELLGVRCLSYELSRWTARGRRAREVTSLPGSGSTYRALRGKRIVVSVPLGEGPIFKNPGSRAWSRRACRAREKPHPYAPFVGRLRRLCGSFRWVRVTYGVASGCRDRGKRNDVKILVWSAVRQKQLHRMRLAVTTRNF
ncbi:hypothetical protein TNCT_217031 [Trichonephila clavata]|uniref:Uncharacterized protein n=1 Tax=Trichonephila clavata TaxID=2740835 RepID=A0A8X6K3Z1_TRICU|nr:hypothetical protein TNCT_217031 [Trichonephila clavata]